MGNKILFYLVIMPISKLPYFLLYGLSDLFFLVLYYVIPYRKKLVAKNIALCFPEKSPSEVKAVQRAYFRHFCDLVFESLKNFSISEEAAHARMEPLNIEAMQKYAAEGRSVVLTGGHYTNWELWAMAAAGHLDHTVVGIYKKLSNAFFDDKMRKSRGKFGMKLVSTRELKDQLPELQKVASAYVYAIDQSPGDPMKSYWTTFMGLETACPYGAEKYAKDFDNPVFYGRGRKVKRGHFTIEYILVADNPRELGYGEVLERCNALLEEDLRDAPEFWLWTHKRWKHKRPSNMEMRTLPPKQ
jgi:Kdo2-lipid IVA lauroyltransferase/acyltransferase